MADMRIGVQSPRPGNAKTPEETWMPRGPQYTKRAIIEHLQRLAFELDEPPSKNQWEEYRRRHGQVSSTTITRNFGGWDKALMAAGLRDSERQHRKPSDGSDGLSVDTKQATYRRQVMTGVIPLRRRVRQYWHWGRREYVEAAVYEVVAEKDAGHWLGVGLQR